jgi:hypothetical protein
VSRIHRPSTDHRSSRISGLSNERSPRRNWELHHEGERENHCLQVRVSILSPSLEAASELDSSVSTRTRRRTVGTGPKSHRDPHDRLMYWISDLKQLMADSEAVAGRGL